MNAAFNSGDLDAAFARDDHVAVWHSAPMSRHGRVPRAEAIGDGRHVAQACSTYAQIHLEDCVEARDCVPSHAARWQYAAATAARGPRPLCLGRPSGRRQADRDLGIPRSSRSHRSGGAAGVGRRKEQGRIASPPKAPRPRNKVRGRMVSRRGRGNRSVPYSASTARARSYPAGHWPQTRPRGSVTASVQPTNPFRFAAGALVSSGAASVRVAVPILVLDLIGCDAERQQRRHHGRDRHRGDQPDRPHQRGDHLFRNDLEVEGVAMPRSAALKSTRIGSAAPT